MKLVYRESDREIVAKVSPGSTSEHVLSWNGSEPVLASGYIAVSAALSLDVREPSKYETDGRISKIPAAPVVDKIALLEAEITAIKAKQAEQDAALDVLKKP